MVVNHQSAIIFCIPVYNDWDCVEQVLKELDVCVEALNRPVAVMLVDDASTQPPPRALSWTPTHIAEIEVLYLRRNVGHQRAIALGLTYIYAERDCHAVLVMDADGEDSPVDAVRLIQHGERTGWAKVVFAKRSKRSEGFVFKLGYFAYRLLHRMLTGRSIEIGNFSVVPRALLERLVGVSEMWNHYAASVVKARLPMDKVPIPRAKRLQGRSKMGFVSLVTHGLSAISVYSDTVGVRLMCFAAALMVTSLGAMGVVLVIRLFTNMAIPGWASSAAGILAGIILNALMLLTVFVFFTLQLRDAASFLPLRDYHHHILGSKSLTWLEQTPTLAKSSKRSPTR